VAGKGLWRNPDLWPALLFLVGGLAAQILLILHLNGGHFSYSLDDAYIHLALAENLLQGHYGVNPNEYSAAASSIIWPFLLVPLLFLLGAFGPLVLNAAAALATLLVWLRLLRLGFSDWRLVALTLTLLIAATNLQGLVFTGMEHNLQVLLASLALWGLVRHGPDAAPVWLVPVLVLGPLVRYENLALSLPALLLLATGKRRPPALWGLAVLLALLGGFSLFLRYGLDLDWLPTSILAKSSLDTSLGASLAENLRLNLRQRPGIVLTAMLFVLAALALSSRRHRDDRVLALWGTATVTLHLLAGRFGLYYRYEIYIWCVALLLLLYLGRGWLAGLGFKKAGLALVLFTLLFGRDYFRPLFSTPQAAAGIYAQQFQLHRFATRYLKAPVAINDLGRVAFENQHYVLDLWGLSQPQALQGRRAGNGSGWMVDLAARHDVELAMIYPQWFDALPSKWQRLGALHMDRKPVTAAHGTVVFYAIDPAAAPRLKRALRAFATDLPSGTRFAFAAKEAP
jgi:hypothetical protein